MSDKLQFVDLLRNEYHPRERTGRTVNLLIACLIHPPTQVVLSSCSVAKLNCVDSLSKTGRASRRRYPDKNIHSVCDSEPTSTCSPIKSQ
jgi:hypothetical protein